MRPVVPTDTGAAKLVTPLSAAISVPGLGISGEAGGASLAAPEPAGSGENIDGPVAADMSRTTGGLPGSPSEPARVLGPASGDAIRNRDGDASGPNFVAAGDCVPTGMSVVRDIGRLGSPWTMWARLSNV